MQETLAHEWQRRMAARSALVAMLLAIPVFAAFLIGFSGGAGGLSFGIGALANGPSIDAVPRSTPALAADLSPLVDASASAAAAGSGPGGAGTGAPGAPGPGIVSPPTLDPVPPTTTPGGTRQPSGGGGEPGGGGDAPSPIGNVVPSGPSPGDPAAEPLAPVGGAVDTVGAVVDEVLGSPR